jgi:hypothetical protein
VLECGSAIEPEAGNPHHGKLDRQHIPFRKRSRGRGEKYLSGTTDAA